MISPDATFILYSYAKGFTQDAKAFCNVLLAFILNRQWEAGWEDEVHGHMTAPSLAKYISLPLPRGIESSPSFIYSTLIGPARIYKNADRALKALTDQLIAEGEEPPKAQYEREAKVHIATTIPEAQSVGGDRKSKEWQATDLFAHAPKDLPDQKRIPLLKSKQPPDESQARILARAKRDRPDLIKRLEAGEFKSARALAREAGWIKVLSKLDVIKHAWRTATAEQRLEIEAWWSERTKAEPRKAKRSARANDPRGTQQDQRPSAPAPRAY